MRVSRKTLATALIVAFVFNLVVMGFGAYLTYEQSPQRPAQITSPDGDVLATNEDIDD